MSMVVDGVERERCVGWERVWECGEDKEEEDNKSGVEFSARNVGVQCMKGGGKGMCVLVTGEIQYSGRE